MYTRNQGGHTVKTSRGLTPEERDFFSKVTQVVLSNNFSDKRHDLENSLLPGLGSDRQQWSVKFQALLGKWVSRLAARKLHRIQDFSGDDREIMEYGFLMDVYLSFVPQLDAIIEAQLQHDAPVEVPFAEELLSRLTQYGFTMKVSLRYLALFHQLRRAFYFIQHSLVGDSASMKQLRHALWSNIFTRDARIYDRHLWNRLEDFSTLLLGETGTGKGSAAAAIGRSGYIPFDRKSGCFKDSFTTTFIAANLSQFPESLIESELFGHRKGAFTGAIDNHKGLFGRSSVHGALFLDEIGDISIPVQLNLLQVLQERTFTPVGSHDVQRFSGRLIAATNRLLHELRQQGSIRDDFFYRLSSDIITIPTLRQRIEESPSELELLVDLFVTRLAGDTHSELTDMVMESLKRDLPADYPWPGNVRELEQAVRRVLLTGIYTAETVTTTRGDDVCERMGLGTITAKELLAHYCSLLYDRFGTYEEVARRTGLDRRTAKKHVLNQ